MNYLFPEIEQHINKTLVVIGNGFDLASGIESSYRDFKRWLQNIGHHRLIGMMDIFFSNVRDVWGDLEKALGEYDEYDILDYCKPNREIDYDHPMRSVAAIEDSPEWIFLPVLNDFIDDFKTWVDSISISNAEKIIDLPLECRYLTFNYTETLEKVYCIPAYNILHIHGSRLSDKEYVIGHNNYRDTSEVYDDESQMIFIQETCAKIIGCMNDMLFKDTDNIIRENKDFFNRLSDVEQVIVYGHSFCECDWPYMVEILKHVGVVKPWKISYHSEEDRKRINSFIYKVGLRHATLFSW